MRHFWFGVANSHILLCHSALRQSTTNLDQWDHYEQASLKLRQITLHVQSCMQIDSITKTNMKLFSHKSFVWHRNQRRIMPIAQMETMMHLMPDFFFYFTFLACFLFTRRVYLSWAWGRLLFNPKLFNLALPYKNVFFCTHRGDIESPGEPLSPLPALLSTSGGRHPYLPGRSSYNKIPHCFWISRTTPS